MTPLIVALQAIPAAASAVPLDVDAASIHFCKPLCE